MARPLIKMFENAFSKVFARRIESRRKLVACCGATDGLAGARQTGQRRRQLLVGRRACNRLARAGQRRQPCRQIDAGPVDIDPIAPRHRGVDSGAQAEMLIFGHATFCAARSGASRRRHQRPRARLERPRGRHPDSSRGHHDSRQNLRRDDTNEVCPSANGEGFVLSHGAPIPRDQPAAPRLLAHERDAGTPNNKLLGGLFFAFSAALSFMSNQFSDLGSCILVYRTPRKARENHSEQTLPATTEPRRANPIDHGCNSKAIKLYTAG